MSETELAQRKHAPKPSRHDAPMPTIRQAAPVETVACRVTKKGSGHISTGVHEAGIGDLMHEMNDVVQIPVDAVAALEERGWVEAQ